MKRTLTTALLAVLGLGSCQNHGERFESALCIANVTTIDAESGLRPNITVVIQNGRILRVEESADL